MRYLWVFVFSLGVMASAAEVTLYQGGFAFVEEQKALEPVGEGIALVPGLPTTIVLGSLAWEGVEASEWRLVPPKRGLEALIGEEVLVSYAGRTARGVLLSLEGGLLLETPEGYLLIPEYESVLAPVKPGSGDLPALELVLAGPAPEEITLRYLVRGLSWEASYIGLYRDGRLVLRGIATLRNGCGVDFTDVSLVAGEVFGPREGESYGAKGIMPLAAAPEVTPVGEYHRYRLPGPVDLRQGETSVEYLPDTAVAAEEVFRFTRGSVLFVLRFENTTGLPLPAGTVRVFGADAFLGEAAIGHTPAGEEVELPLGAAFDLVGERLQTEYVRLAEDRYREGYRIVIRSAKKEPVTVEIIEEMRGEWRITDSSLPYEILDAHRVLFRLAVPPEGEAELTYTVEYTY
ncbi:MAG: hypothetical protein GXO72_02355 [Caldiserica bacterium]|nr:hypothetical protein [Caldisericota bacterium]